MLPHRMLTRGSGGLNVAGDLLQALLTIQINFCHLGRKKSALTSICHLVHVCGETADCRFSPPTVKSWFLAWLMGESEVQRARCRVHVGASQHTGVKTQRRAPLLCLFIHGRQRSLAKQARLQPDLSPTSVGQPES